MGNEVLPDSFGVAYARGSHVPLQILDNIGAGGRILVSAHDGDLVFAERYGVEHVGQDLFDLVWMVDLVANLEDFFVFALDIFVLGHLDLGDVIILGTGLDVSKCQLVFLLDIFDQAALVEIVAPELLDQFGLPVVVLDARLQFILGVLDARLVGVAPAGERIHDKVSDALGDLLVALGGIFHLGADAIVGLI